MKKDGVFENIAEMVYPSDIKCIFCDAELNDSDEHCVCGKCEPLYNTTFCICCGTPLIEGNKFCDRCTGNTRAFIKARSTFVFKDDAADLVYRYKYNNERYLSAPMAEFMKDTLLENGWKIDIITYVPLHKKRQKARGYNQSELLAKNLGEKVNIPVIKLLDKVKSTKNMAKLSAKERAELIKDTFNYCENAADLKGKNILLVDDVLTTGATSNECSTVLIKKGANVYVLAFAATKIKQYLVKKTGNDKIKLPKKKSK